MVTTLIPAAPWLMGNMSEELQLKQLLCETGSAPPGSGGLCITMETTQTVPAGARSYLSVVVDLCFLLDVGVELGDVGHVAVRLLAVGVTVAVCRGDRGTRSLICSSGHL